MPSSRNALSTNLPSTSSSFGCRRRVDSKSEKPPPSAAKAVDMSRKWVEHKVGAELDELARSCRNQEHFADVLGPAWRGNFDVPKLKETTDLLNKSAFDKMKDGVMITNCARGGIVNEDDLHAAMESGKVAGAALDVFETEPLPADHPLWQMENAILTPHVAAASVHIADRHLATLLLNIRRFVSGQEPVTLVDKHKWF